jgi:predicted Zn-dependent protease
MPGQRSARNKLSLAEARDLDVRIQFLEGLVRREPAYVEALQLLGEHYTQRGRYAEGLQVDERLARLEPRSPLVFYNLACSYALTDQPDRAIAALERALSLGYRDFKWLARDPDLRELRKHPLFRRVRDKIRRLKITVR